MAPPDTPELRQVLRGLALNRTPGWNFPGNFVDLSFDRMEPSGTAVSIEPGPHCTLPDGQVDLGTLGVIADIGLAAGMRREVGLASRMATVSLSLQLTGAPRSGRLEVHGQFDGFVAGAAGRQGLSRCEIRSPQGVVATGTGSFMALGNREGTAPLPVRRRGEARDVAPLDVGELNEQERGVYDRAVAALAGGEGGSFVERFWGLVPKRDGDGATCELANGLHVGNRVGHTQGGITFALAAATAVGALDAEWHLVGVCAWYVYPGTGPFLRAHASIVHRGRLTAVVRTRLADHEDRTVLEATTSHARVSRPAPAS